MGFGAKGLGLRFKVYGCVIPARSVIDNYSCIVDTLQVRITSTRATTAAIVLVIPFAAYC